MATATITVGEITISLDAHLVACDHLDCPAIGPTHNVTTIVAELDNLKTRRDRLARARKYPQMAEVVKLRNATLLHLRSLIEHYNTNATEYACTHR